MLYRTADICGWQLMYIFPPVSFLHRASFESKRRPNSV